MIAIVARMLTKPTTDALTALAQFVETPRWRDVEALLDQEIEAVILRLIGARLDADAHELRGRLASLREFRQTALTARSTLGQLGRNVPLT